MTKDTKPVTKIEKNSMKMARKDWEWFVAETHAAIGLELHDTEPCKGPVRMSLDAWLFTLSCIEAALTYSGASARGGDCQECCDDKCSGFGGCDFCFGTACVCNQGDLFRCSGAA